MWLDTFYEETEHDGYSLRIKTHYVGMETLCNVACDVYEIKDNGFGVYKKFWIDPQNGATLKYIEKGDGKDYEFELTQYSLLGPYGTTRSDRSRTPQQDAHNKRSKGRRGPETSFCYVPPFCVRRGRRYRGALLQCGNRGFQCLPPFRNQLC